MTKEEIFQNYQYLLSLQRPTLTALFYSAYESIEKKSNAPLLGDSSSTVIEALNEANVLEYSQQIYAGSLFLVCDRWIRSLAMELGLKDREVRLNAGEVVQNTRLSKLIWAIGNNFRHYFEWAKNWERLETLAKQNEYTELQGTEKEGVESIRALWNAGVKGYLGELCGAQTLQVIACQDYEEFEAKLHDIGKGLLKSVR